MKLYDTVKEMLEKYPKLRDDDKLLIWNVWGVTGLIKNGSIAREDFLQAPHTESIRRVRQKIQEKHPHLAPSVLVESARKTKERQKGTFVYREKIPVQVNRKWLYVDGKAIEITE